MAAETKKKKNHLKTWISLYIAVLVVLYIIIYAYPSVTGALTPTTTLTYDELRVTDDVTCYFVRSEQVVKAERGGAANYYVPEGTMTRKGIRVLDVNATSGGGIKNYTLQQTGVVSYYIDGSESYFTPDTMASLTETGAEEHGENPKNTMRTSVLSDEPLYKVVNSDVWYTVFWVDSGEIANYQKDASVTLELSLGSVPGTVFNIVDNGDKWLVILKFDRYYEEMTQLRKTEATVVTEDYKGLVVPNESLVTVDGKLGVYVKNLSGEYDFTRVKVITTDGESSLVKDSYFYEESGEVNDLGEKVSVKVDTVKIYDEILKSGKP